MHTSFSFRPATSLAPLGSNCIKTGEHLAGPAHVPPQTAGLYFIFRPRRNQVVLNRVGGPGPPGLTHCPGTNCVTISRGDGSEFH